MKGDRIEVEVEVRAIESKQVTVVLTGKLFDGGTQVLRISDQGALAEGTRLVLRASPNRLVDDRSIILPVES